MKRKLILALVAGLIPVSLMAQDDLYFVPKKSTPKIKSSYEAIGGSDTSTTIYVGSNCDVDEYNRKGLSKYFQKIGTDSLGNDIVAFISDSLVTDTLHVYPGTEVKYDMEDDYTYSRRMSRFDDYYWYDPWFYSYGYGSGPYWSPWNYRWGWYDPWYYTWYDPWYYDWHYGWHSSWYYPYYYWGYPIYVGGGGHRPIYAHNNGITGTRNHGTVNRGGATNRPNNFGGYRGNGKDRSVANNRGSGNGSFGGRRPSSDGTRNGSYGNNGYSSSSNNGSFGGSRNSSSGSRSNSSYTPSSNGSSSYGGGSFGGSRSSGGSFGGGGGSRSGGGGGGHSSGGGGSFGGRR